MGAGGAGDPGDAAAAVRLLADAVADAGGRDRRRRQPLGALGPVPADGRHHRRAAVRGLVGD